MPGMLRVSFWKYFETILEAISVTIAVILLRFCSHFGSNFCSNFAAILLDFAAILQTFWKHFGIILEAISQQFCNDFAATFTCNDYALHISYISLRK